jgi:hypothetical protein
MIVQIRRFTDSDLSLEFLELILAYFLVNPEEFPEIW